MGQRWPLRNIIRATSRLPAQPAGYPLTGRRSCTNDRADSLPGEPDTHSSQPAVIGDRGVPDSSAAHLGGRQGLFQKSLIERL
jgi:hypothetical protein